MLYVENGFLCFLVSVFVLFLCLFVVLYLFCFVFLCWEEGMEKVLLSCDIITKVLVK